MHSINYDAIIQADAESFRNIKVFQILSMIPKDFAAKSIITTEHVFHALLNHPFDVELYNPVSIRLKLFRYAYYRLMNTWNRHIEFKTIEIIGDLIKHEFSCNSHRDETESEKLAYKKAHRAESNRIRDITDCAKATRQILSFSVCSIERLLKEHKVPGYVEWKHETVSRELKAKRDVVSREAFIVSSEYRFFCQYPDASYGSIAPKSLYEMYVSFCNANSITSITTKQFSIRYANVFQPGKRTAKGRSIIVDESSVKSYLNQYLPIKEDIIEPVATPTVAPIVHTHQHEEFDYEAIEKRRKQDEEQRRLTEIREREEKHRIEKEEALQFYMTQMKLKLKQRDTYDGDSDDDYDESDEFDKDDPFFKAIDYEEYKSTIEASKRLTESHEDSISIEAIQEAKREMSEFSHLIAQSKSQVNELIRLENIEARERKEAERKRRAKLFK